MASTSACRISANMQLRTSFVGCFGRSLQNRSGRQATALSGVIPRLGDAGRHAGCFRHNSQNATRSPYADDGKDPYSQRPDPYSRENRKDPYDNRVSPQASSAYSDTGRNDRDRRGAGRNRDVSDSHADSNVRGGSNRKRYGGPLGAPSIGGMPDRMGELGQNLRQPNWQDEKLVSIQKNFYTEHPEVSRLTPEQVQQVLTDLKANMKGRTPHAKPVRSFSHLQLAPEIMKVVSAQGFSAPTPIQSVGWPTALSGRDMVGVAQTGSGKTLAYLLPAIVHLSAQPPLKPGDGPLVLIIAPTRELVMQIHSEAEKMTQGSSVRSVAVFGGVSRYGQAAEMRRGVEMCIATPGRMLDFLESGVTNLKRVTYLCLDEADRMLDMGFEQQIRKLASQIRPDRQTLMWSATWPREIQRLARDFCREDPIKLTIGADDLSVNPDIVQQVEVVDPYDKRGRFIDFIKGAAGREAKVLVFTETKHGADSLCRELQYHQLAAQAIHGDKDQHQRDRTLGEFRIGQCNILIATDVAQRGLDIKDVEYVVNFDVPKTLEDYIHRIGRTGRAGKKGTALTFFPAQEFTPDVIRMARSISTAMQDAGQEPSTALLKLARGGR